ncbi:MAG: glutamate--tRNA ligase, partial [Proteobacteria bacterium]|nr:glutamate--tRNA ligase [Pseudomonadota bacterium]
MSDTVTRFAPSPTGFLHIGGARTALFSWLLAKSQGGKFLLRIEDTDRERSTQEAIDAILEAMTWLGLDHDGEVYYQSQRADRHNEVIDQLVESGHAYWCNCSKEDVDAMRDKARAAGRKPKYDGRCRERGLGPDCGGVVRFKTPLAGAVSYTDMVKGPSAVNVEELDDLILRRSDGGPTYNLAVVVDDHDMGVTQVLRGDDHVNNTFRQIPIYEAMGWQVPSFGHVPMILGPDKKKLSKRHGALSVMEYEKMGYLPEAVLNYLVRLGWSHGDQEVFTREELTRLFTTDTLSSSPSVFDLQKLEWMSGQYMQGADVNRLTAEVTKIIEFEVGRDEAEKLNLKILPKAIPLLQPRAKHLVDLAEQARLFIVDVAFLMYDEAAVQKFLTPEARS